MRTRLPKTPCIQHSQLLPTTSPHPRFPLRPAQTAICCIFPLSAGGAILSIGLYFFAVTGAFPPCPGSVFVPGYVVCFFSSFCPPALNGFGWPGLTAVFFSGAEGPELPPPPYNGL